MAKLKFSLDRLKKRHGYHGEKLSELMAKIIDFNSTKLNNAIYRIKASNFKKFDIQLPGIEEVLPKRSLNIKKAAVRGELITDNLRDEMTADLRQLFKEHGFKRNRAMVQQMKEALRDKLDESKGRIKNIAVTEINSSLNEIKETFHQRLIEKNPSLLAFKEWRHYKSYSRNPRKGHQEANHQTVKADKPFHVKLYDGKGRYVRTDLMDRPHDPKVRLDQIIGCSCSVQYFYRKRFDNIVIVIYI